MEFQSSKKLVIDVIHSMEYGVSSMEQFEKNLNIKSITMY